MRRKKLRVSIWACLLFCTIFPLQATSILAAEEQEDIKDKGKLRFDINRIGEKGEEKSSDETELDKRFPELFKKETNQKIEEKQQKLIKEKEQLHDVIFSNDIKTQNTVTELKQNLFTDEYVGTKVSKRDEETSNSVSWLFPIVALATIGVLFTIIYQMMTGRSSNG